MQIITGQSARKENFWQREKEIKEILHKINSHQHILLVAPRRVGKTSIMHYLLDNPEDKVVLYIDTESANSENEFWKKLFNKLMSEEFEKKSDAEDRSLTRDIRREIFGD